MTYNVFGGTLSLTQSINHASLTWSEQSPVSLTILRYYLYLWKFVAAKLNVCGSCVHIIYIDENASSS